MAQDWDMRYRLIHGQGNFGSIAGLPPAAHRYTEARLTPVAAEMLDDLDRDTVDFIDNYDGKYREPLVLPGKFPNLLVNGSDGIAVGMATDIPPHNLREVCDGAHQAHRRTRTSSLAGADGDHPRPGLPDRRHHHGPAGDHRRLPHRPRQDHAPRPRRDHRGGEGEDASIIIREVPFQLTRNRSLEAIGELVKDERIKGISDVRDESSARNGEPVRLVIDLKRDADPHLVLNQLYQFSPLQKTVSIILLALVDGRPQCLTLKEMLEEFLGHRVQVIRRRTEYLLREAKRRGHVLEGQLIAIVARRGDPHLPHVAEPGRGEGAAAGDGGRRRA